MEVRQTFPCVSPCPLWLKVCLTVLGLVTLVSCSRGTDAQPKEFDQISSQIKTATPALPEAAPPDNAPLPHIDAKRAFQYTREVTAFGPRYMGSENHKKLERYILDHLKGDQVEDDAFTADTVEGKFPVRNIIAKFPGTKDGIIVILGHYDTNYPLRNIGYVGANDGGSSTAILLEFANQLRGGGSGKSAMATASGWSGLTAKKRCGSGPTPTVSTAPAIWPRNGKKTARLRRSKRSW